MRKLIPHSPCATPQYLKSQGELDMLSSHLLLSDRTCSKRNGLKLKIDVLVLDNCRWYSYTCVTIDQSLFTVVQMYSVVSIYSMSTYSVVSMYSVSVYSVMSKYSVSMYSVGQCTLYQCTLSCQCTLCKLTLPCQCTLYQGTLSCQCTLCLYTLSCQRTLSMYVVVSKHYNAPVQSHGNAGCYGENDSRYFPVSQAPFIEKTTH